MQGILASDKDLVEAVRAGDDSAYEELYRRYKRRISAFVAGFVRDEGRAEDVTQEAFLSALRRIRCTESEITFRPWIYEIARNAAIDLHRRTSKAEEVSISEVGALRPADRRHLVGGRAPDSALAEKQRLDHLRGAFEELSESHHRILVLRELEGRTYKEIGEEMQLTPPAVESTLFRARRRLEHEYTEIDTGRRCTSMRLIIGQLAEGVESPRERSKLARHARHCNFCRRRARQLGVDPFEAGARSIAARAAALIPLPAFIQRRLGPQVPPDASAAMGLTHAAVAAESSGVLLAKAGALLAAAAFVGGGVHMSGSDGASPERVLPQGPAGAPAKPAEARRATGRPAAAPGRRRTESVLGSEPRRPTSRIAPQSQAGRPAPSAPGANTPADPAPAPQAPTAGMPALPDVGGQPDDPEQSSPSDSFVLPEAGTEPSDEEWRPDGAEGGLPDVAATASSAIDGV